MIVETLLKEWLRLIIEDHILSSVPHTEEEQNVREMCGAGGAGGIGSFGYQLPLGVDADDVNVKDEPSHRRSNRKRKAKKNTG